MTASPPSSGPSPRQNLRPTLRERLGRRPFGLGFWVGAAILGAYAAAAVSALVVFRSTLSTLSVNPAWIPTPPFAPAIGPSWSHPFGVLAGRGVDLFQAVWQATPWDLAIVGGILGFDAVLGWFLGAIAGLNDGGVVDSLVSWVGDTLGAIPSFFLVVGIFAAWSTLAPREVSIPVFILLFGLIIWPSTARLTRERARFVARQPYVEAAKACGASRLRILFRHVLPGSITGALAQLPLDLAPIFFVLIIFPWFWGCQSTGTIYSLPPFSPLPSVTFPEWGSLLAVGVCEGVPISTGFVAGPVYWWMFVFPLAAIMLLAYGIALVCDGLDRRLSSFHR